MACNGENLTTQDINKLLRFLKARKYIIYEKQFSEISNQINGKTWW